MSKLLLLVKKEFPFPIPSHLVNRIPAQKVSLKLLTMYKNIKPGSHFNDLSIVLFRMFPGSPRSPPPAGAAVGAVSAFGLALFAEFRPRSRWQKKDKTLTLPISSFNSQGELRYPTDILIINNTQ